MLSDSRTAGDAGAGDRPDIGTRGEERWSMETPTAESSSVSSASERPRSWPWSARSLSSRSRRSLSARSHRWGDRSRTCRRRPSSGRRTWARAPRAYDAREGGALMQVTITGGTGSLAEYVANELAQEHDLVLFDRLEPGRNRFQYELRGQLVTGDLTCFDDCQRAVAGSRAVIHLGAIPYPVDHPDVVKEAREQGRELPPWDE